MSSRVGFSFNTGFTLWAACRDDVGEVLDVAGAGGLFEAWVTAADYDITIAEDNSRYIIDMDDFTSLPAGTYTLEVYIMAGATADNADLLIREIERVIWDGTDVLYGLDANGRVDVGAVLGTSQTANDNGADINSIKTKTDNLPVNTAQELTDIDGAISATATQSALNAAQADLDIITGADGVNLLSATQASIDAIETDTETTIPGLISTHDGKLDTAQTDLDTITGADGVNLLSATQASIDAIETDTETTIPGLISTLDGVLDGYLADGGTIDALIDLIKAKTDNLPANTSTELDAIDTAVAAIAIGAGAPRLGD